MKMYSHEPDMLDVQMAEVFRRKTEAERLAIAHGLWRSARRLISAMLCAQHPDWEEDRVKLETARRLSHGAI
jgi:lauroyl/myristoyl acyltransferase